MIEAPTPAGAWLHHSPADATALREGDRSVTYGQLRTGVGERLADFDLPRRSVVVLTGERTVDYVVSYLALLDGGHVPLLAGEHADELADRWSAAAVVDAQRTGWTIDHRPGTEIELHPDLALLLSTSGSTGSPTLVRLSHDNLRSNASAIADYLGLTSADHGVTSLPLHYCYGLSVLHAHLSVGAGVSLVEASVVDPCFHRAMRDHGVTNLAGVPYTFELLERVGVDAIDVPTLRLITQAGGRLQPDRVRRWLDLTESWDAEFVVMYGQTEATARMAYLPPEIARRRPESVGRAIPGGQLSLRPADDVDDPDIGELVYRGPNVMLGTAQRLEDLARGRDIDELHTGDLARFHADDGVYEIVGRRSRFVKPYGLRIDLAEVERQLADIGEVAVAGDDDRLVVAAPNAGEGALRDRVAARTGLPGGAILVDASPELPRTSSGKPDYCEIMRRGECAQPRAVGSLVATSPVTRVYADVLDRHGIRSIDTFVGLGGDSLSYVECSVHLERLLGPLPDGWHLRPIAELDALASSRPPGRLARLDTTILLRAIGILAVVATHMRFWRIPGGAHILLAVAGYNVARFLLPIEPARERLRAGLRTVSRIAVPTVVWVGIGMIVTNAAFGVGTLLLVNNYIGPSGHQGDHWHFWFIEVVIHLMLVTTLVGAIPAVRRADRRWPYGFPLAILGVGLFLRLEWFWFDDWFNFRYRTHSLAWFFVLGWIIHRSDSWPRRVAATGLSLALIPGAFDQPEREWFVIGALVVLIWAREIPVIRPAVRPIATIAAASMWILISHFTFWPPLKDALPLPIAYALTIVAGIGVWSIAERAVPASVAVVRRSVVRRRRSDSAITSPPPPRTSPPGPIPA